MDETPRQRLMKYHSEYQKKRERDEISKTVKKPHIIPNNIVRCAIGKTGRTYIDGLCSICGGKPNKKSFYDQNEKEMKTYYGGCI